MIQKIKFLILLFLVISFSYNLNAKEIIREFISKNITIINVSNNVIKQVTLLNNNFEINNLNISKNGVENIPINDNSRFCVYDIKITSFDINTNIANVSILNNINICGNKQIIF